MNKIDTTSAAKPVDRPEILIQNPATLEPLGRVVISSEHEIDAAVRRGEQAMIGAWCDVDTRRKALADIADAMEREQALLARMITLEQGKPLFAAKMEVATATRIARYYATWQEPDQILRDNAQERIYVDRIPLGVVGLIVPWNFPITILFMKLGPALRAGNTVVIKPSPSTPLTTLKLVELVTPYLPDGVLNVVTGDAAVGAALCTHPRIAKISFTGSTNTGRKVMASAAGTLKRLTLELGGNDPAIVLADADLDHVVQRLSLSAFGAAAGQICQACKRIYVHRSIHDDLVDRLEQAAKMVVVGDGLDEATRMGPLHSAMQRDFVQSLLNDARDRNARVYQEGPDLPSLPGHFLRPAVVSGISPDAPVVMQEQFGPVLPVVPFETVEEAISMANAGEYGLDASVWSSDEDRAVRVAGSIRAGNLYINTHATPPDPQIPFGGAKQSGFGAELGDWGIDDVSQRRVIRIEHLARHS